GDLDLALDVLRDVAAQVTLDLEVAVDVLTDPADLLLGEVPDLRAGVDLRAVDDRARAGRADAVDVAERDVHPLLAREVDACDSCHGLPLSLLVPRVVRADHEHAAATPDDLAPVAHLLHARPDFHNSTLFRSRDRWPSASYSLELPTYTDRRSAPAAGRTARAPPGPGP